MEFLSTFPECVIGISTLNDGSVDTLEHVHALLNTVVSYPFAQIVLPKHQHATICRQVSRLTESENMMVDGLITSDPGVVLAHRFGDCVPIVILDRRRRCLASLHAGWRGLTQGIVAEGVLSLQAVLRSNVEDIWVWIGPCIQKNSYISRDEPLQTSLPYWKPYITQEQNGFHIDLPGFITAQCIRLGMSEEHIISDGRDTYSQENIFYSHRRAMEANNAASDGRFVTVAWLV
ncbi:hypothetical protein C5B42_01210 [Candidatus Cerribacteria bacterium 'Amazon FNV 2010 28 9']|uniref:Purine nucleoside phosphorylase n=1 Tax=Candidatus Cerribacteria bacterium 'Amazon FNV 2010 28 9' TaxID=2081795 RepID=A0A317JUX3_9BACT|nr:MAG: hypothetical protein C5B42_01210 [Candidatus Cerribacteria bacterium 'Amazon FNV 2010 28 9']